MVKRLLLSTLLWVLIIWLFAGCIRMSDTEDKPITPSKEELRNLNTF
ncbi:MAG TPA: hypothetical protein VMX17_11685 [Candidatus Glassbacteria bacterium]|nr:hypothetical protein [Candidatus Glassbacteria bacterium]